MAIDLSNVGPGGATRSSLAQARRERLARRKKRPITGPGATGLGIGPERGIVNAQGDVYMSSPAVRTFTQNVLDMQKRPGSYGQYLFENVDTMLFKDRMAPARQWLEGGGKDFKVTVKDQEDMIRGGILTYGKTEGMPYAVPSVTANLQGFNQFLRDNFRQGKSGKWQRQDPKKGLTVSDTATQLLAYGGIAGGDPTTIENAAVDFVSGKRTRNPRAIGTSFENLPTRGTGENKAADYGKMANTFKKDKEQETKFFTRIAGQVKKKGGDAVWNKILTGEYTPQDVANLRKYMYSPDGSYGQAQEKFITQKLLNQQFNPMNQVAAESAEAIIDLQEANAKSDSKDLETRNKKVAENSDEYFNSRLTPEEKFYNMVSMIEGSGEFPTGMGDYIPTAIINEVMRDGVGHYVQDSSVNGGKRFVEAPMRGLNEGQKTYMLQAVAAAAEKGYPIPPALVPYLEEIQKGLQQKAAPAKKKAVEDGGFLSDLWNIGTSEIAPSPKDWNWGRILGIEESKKYDETGRVIPRYRQSVPEQLFNVTGEEVMGSVQPMLTSSYLTPTPAAEADAGDVAVNALRSAATFGVGFMPGLYYLASEPTTVIPAIAADYAHRYGSWDNFKQSFKEDPLSPVLDAIALVSGVGMGVKASQIGVAGVRLGAARGKTVPREVWRGDDGKVAYSSLTPDERINYNAALKQWDESGRGVPRPQPEQFLAQVPLMPKKSGISTLEYASLARAAVNDPVAALRLNALLPRGTNGSNSLANPGAMDRAAAFFQPRYKFVSRADGNKVIEDEDMAMVLNPNTALEAVRLTGNPVNRAMQSVFLTAQMRGGKMSPRIANMRLLGFNYRFDKAKEVSSLTEAEAIRREFAMLNLYQKAIDKMKLSDVEQMVVFDELSGGGYSPAIRAATLRKSLRERAKSGMDDQEVQLKELELNRLEDEVFLREYANRKTEMLDGVSERGKELHNAKMALMMQMEKQNRLVSAFDSPETIEYALNAYAPLLDASRLRPPHIMEELGTAADNLASFNPNYHFTEQLRTMGEAYVVDDGKLRPIKAGDETKPLVDRMEQDMERMRSDTSFRDLAGNPFFIVDEVIPDKAGNPIAVSGRRLRIEGDILENDTFERAPLVDREPLLLPYSAFLGDDKGKISMMARETAAKQLHIGAANTMNQLYPNVRDMVDKISDRSIKGKESFANRRNRNVVVATGMQDYHLKVQFDAHRAYLRRRVEEGWTKFFEDEAIPVYVRDFDRNTQVPIKTQKIFDTEEEAQIYADTYDELGAVERGEVNPREYKGKTVFLTTMKYFDTMMNTVMEQRTKNLGTVDDFQNDFIMGLREIPKLNPDEIIMVVPKTTYRKFSNTQADIDKAIKESLGMLATSADLLSDLFKIATLSMNPRFIPQNVIGSTMMLGLGAPELFPQAMATLLTQAARKGKRTITREQYDIFSHHMEDFNYMSRVMPHDFLDNVFYKDRAEGILGRMGDSTLAKYTIFNGYTAVFAFESNMRAAIMRAAALKYPGFKAVMRAQETAAFAKAGLPELGMETLSPFQAAFEIMRTTDSTFMHSVRHTADGILGNYRDFGPVEQAVRNYLIPFYAWQRHSALFTKRLFQERPLTANAAFQLGNYGFERVTAAGGIPEWMYESVPMPEQLADILELAPDRMNRLMLGSLNPFSTTTDGIMAAGGMFAGQGMIPSGKGLFDYTNPFVNAIIEQNTGISTFTGRPLTDEEKDKGLGERFLGLFAGFPAIATAVNAFKSASELNQFAGSRGNPESILVNPDDPKSKLSIPGDKLTEKFPTLSVAGGVNVFSPVRVASLDPEELVRSYKKEASERGIDVGGRKYESTPLIKHTRALAEWKRKRDYVLNVWMPQFGSSYPELASRVIGRLSIERPDTPDYYPEDLYDRVMGGQ